MLGHMRKRRTDSKYIEVNSVDEGSIPAKEYIKEACKDKPMWAIALSGLRCRDNLTQKQLGELISVSQYNISKMERGHRPIGKNIAKRLAKVFKADYRLFL